MKQTKPQDFNYVLQVKFSGNAIPKEYGYKTLKEAQAEQATWNDYERVRWTDIKEQSHFDFPSNKQTPPPAPMPIDKGNGQKPFHYLGLTFYPQRKFTDKETNNDSAIIMRSLSSIGISNYKGDMYKNQNHISDKWDYDAFYKAAKKAGAGDKDIFVVNNTIVIPCKNELFKYLSNPDIEKPIDKGNGQDFTVRDLVKQYPDMYNYYYKWRNTDEPELEKDINEVLADHGYKFAEETEADYNDLKGYLNCPIIPLHTVDKGNGHTPGEWSVRKCIKEGLPFEIYNSSGHSTLAYVTNLTNYSARANAKLIASAPQLKTENEALKEQNARAKQQIIDLIEALTPFADVWNEFTEIKRRQAGEVFQYNDKKLLVSDFEKANDLLSYLSHHQVK